jgi:5-methyltetrahydropteroyltriglutamate--homocysteine methyltransferase
MTIETADVVASRIRNALPHVPAERVVIAPDCGMKYLPRDVAFGKMQAMVQGADIVRREQHGN